MRLRPAEPPGQPFAGWTFIPPEDQDIVVWVTRALDAEKWTAIREIGVHYDAALVVTTQRPLRSRRPTQTRSPCGVFRSPTTSLTADLLKGVNLRWLDWMHFAAARRPSWRLFTTTAASAGLNLTSPPSTTTRRTHVGRPLDARRAGRAHVERQSARRRGTGPRFTR